MRINGKRVETALINRSCQTVERQKASYTTSSRKAHGHRKELGQQTRDPNSFLLLILATAYHVQHLLTLPIHLKCYST